MPGGCVLWYAILLELQSVGSTGRISWGRIASSARDPHGGGAEWPETKHYGLISASVPYFPVLCFFERIHLHSTQLLTIVINHAHGQFRDLSLSYCNVILHKLIADWKLFWNLVVFSFHLLSCCLEEYIRSHDLLSLNCSMCLWLHLLREQNNLILPLYRCLSQILFCSLSSSILNLFLSQENMFDPICRLWKYF